jgi:glycosyltransferase involved in cell wall biosynthesis
MRIAIDIRRVNEFGIGTYIWNLVRNLSQVDEQNQYMLAGSDRDFQELGPLRPNFTRLLQPERSGSWRGYVSMPIALGKHKPDVVHIPHHHCPFMVPHKLVVTIHDCAHVKFPPENLSRLRRYELYWRTKRALHRASQILAVSNFTRDDLVDIFDIDSRRISVIHNALDERFAPAGDGADRKTVLERYQLHDPFILYSGRIRPHKNIHRLIEAFAVLKNELSGDERYRNLKLIVIGDELSRHQYLRLTVVRSGGSSSSSSCGPGQPSSQRSRASARNRFSGLYVAPRPSTMGAAGSRCVIDS